MDLHVPILVVAPVLTIPLHAVIASDSPRLKPLPPLRLTFSSPDTVVVSPENADYQAAEIKSYTEKFFGDDDNVWYRSGVSGSWDYQIQIAQTCCGPETIVSATTSCWELATDVYCSYDSKCRADV